MRTWATLRAPLVTTAVVLALGISNLIAFPAHRASGMTMQLLNVQTSATLPGSPRGALRWHGVGPKPVAPSSLSPLPAPVSRSLSRAALIACLVKGESGGNYTANTGNGYTGAAQWVAGTWNSAVRAIGQPQYANGRADLAPQAVQDAATWWWGTHVGWSQWPETSGPCGL